MAPRVVNFSSDEVSKDVGGTVTPSKGSLWSLTIAIDENKISERSSRPPQVTPSIVYPLKILRPLANLVAGIAVAHQETAEVRQRL
ncbi:unnamed protein product [Arctia plantaginis]|uniref:Uncharacterized protein n=1 Tax=Arctia plantaginis TaxID=874455 RepID=A0A8S0Z0L0_ARCPL|nr:unnamed protein product [Arctia plantaginis]